MYLYSKPETQNILALKYTPNVFYNNWNESYLATTNMTTLFTEY
jgi:hypothetical protein